MIPTWLRPGVRVRHVHSSGRYDKSPESLERALRRYARSADVITLTEVSAEKRAQAMKAIPGWGHVRGTGGPAADESGIMWRDATWKLVAKYAHLLARDSGGVRLAVWSTTAVLIHRTTGQLLLISVAHLPAGVEGDYHGKMTPKVAAHTLATARWRQAINAVADEHHVDGILAAADFNLDYHQTWVREWADRKFGRLKPAWADRLPDGGSHGRRLIDWALTDLRVTSAKLARDDASSDHRPIRTVARLPRLPRVGR